MCQIRINLPINNRLENLELETIPVCETCENRDWCPIFILAIKPCAEDIIVKYPIVSEAIIKTLFKKDKAYQEGNVQLAMIYTGVLGYIKNNNVPLNKADTEKGKMFLKNAISNEITLNVIQYLLVNDMPKEAK